MNTPLRTFPSTRFLVATRACLTGLLFCWSIVWAQTVSPPAPATSTEQSATPATSRRTTSPPVGDVTVLSPFEVTASNNDIGYYAENTLAGSRLSTNIGDLAASISVVTRQQMLDTASVEMNDVFLYEANTEGTKNFNA